MYKDNPEFSEGFCFWLVLPNRYLFSVVLICVTVAISNDRHCFRCNANTIHRDNPCPENLFYSGQREKSIYIVLSHRLY